MTYPKPGKRYGKLVVVKLNNREKIYYTNGRTANNGLTFYYRYFWDCICDCGNRVVLSPQHFRNKKPSCGCNRHNPEHTATKLNWEKVREIRENLHLGNKILAEVYSISETHVARVIKNINWKEKQTFRSKEKR